MVLAELFSNIITEFILSVGYIGIFLWMVLDSMPIPVISGEVIMPFAGYLTFLGNLNFVLVVIVGSLGSLIGSLVTYFIGLKGGRPFLKKYGKYFLMSEKDIRFAESIFTKYGHEIVLVSRMIPLIRTFISFPAGIVEMNFKKFVIYTLIGSLIWNSFLTYLGFSLGSEWQTIISFFNQFDIPIIIILIILFFYYIKFKRR